jgi:hypothetical protein
LVLLGQHGDIVLVRVGDPEVLVANIRDALVREPVVLVWKGLVNAVVEVFVVGEDNVATDIVELHIVSNVVRGKEGSLSLLRTKPSGVTSVEASPPGISFESTIIHEGPS